MKTINKSAGYEPVSEDYLKDRSDRTGLIRDRISPVIKSNLAGTTAGVGGAVLGAGLGIGTKKITGKAMKALISPKTTGMIANSINNNLGASHLRFSKSTKLNRAIKKPATLFFGKEYAKARQLAAAGAGAAAMAPKAKKIGEVAHNTAELRRQYIDQFGVEPSEGELMEVAKLNHDRDFDRSLSKLFYTPNAMTKSTFRNIRQMNNMPYVINEEEQRMRDLTPMFYPGGPSPYSTNNFRHAQSECNDIEKVALSMAGVRDKANDIISASRSMANTVSKYAPSTGAAIGAGAAIMPAYQMSDKLVDHDSNHRGLKKALLTATGAGLGAGTGVLIGRTGGDLVKGVVDKVTDPLNSMKKSLHSYADDMKMASVSIDAIEKVARTFQEKVRDAQHRKMNEQQFNEFTGNLNSRYNANSNYEMIDDAAGSFMVPNEAIKNNKLMRKALKIDSDGSDGKNFIRTGPLDEVILHETGHALDKDLAAGHKRYKRLNSAGNTSMIGGLVGGQMIENPYASAAVTGGGVLGGVYLKNRASKEIEKREDRANEFVKRYYTDQFGGDRAKGEEAFNKSLLPSARKTYSSGTRAKTIGTLLVGGVPASMNIYNKFKRR